VVEISDFNVVIGFFSCGENLGSLLNLHLKIVAEWKQVPRYSQHRILGKSARYLVDW